MKSRNSRGNLQSNLKVRIPGDYPWKVLNALVEDHRYLLSPAEEEEVSTIIRNRDLPAYLSLSDRWGPCGINPRGTLALVPFRAKYQISALLKKYRFPTERTSRVAAAKEKFLAAERQCAEYNRAGYAELRDLSDPLERKAFTYALRFLRRLLAPYLPEPEQLTLWSRHGPGANLDTKKGQTSLYFKYSEWPYSCTSSALGYARDAIRADERWYGALENSYRERNQIPRERILNQDVFWSSVLKPVDANRIAFVPKNALTERSIAIEPSMNLYLQLGVDGFIRRRLKRWGVDLDDQSKNQALALKGSRDWSDNDPHVTLDLSAASDTVSLAVCETLLPPAWFSYLCLIRSPNGELDGETISYEKISSMGNGYTFALESAIFTALVYGVTRAVRGSFDRADFAVYGDDIVVRRSLAPLLIKMLNKSGFAINAEKSFLEGPFRESCGADYFSGEPVRPVFLSELPSTVCGVWGDLNRLTRLLWLVNLDWDAKTPKLFDRWIPPLFKEFVGPCSDTEFTSYKHTPLPRGKYRNGVWEFRKLVVAPKPRNGGLDFHFRKLMNPLRSGRAFEWKDFWSDLNRTGDTCSPRWASRSWGGGMLTAGGSSFTVTDNLHVAVSVGSSQTSIWSGQYSTLIPLTTV